EPVSNAELASRAEKIFEQLRRFNALIENLLDVTWLTQGRLAFAIEELELSQLVREVAARLEDQAARAGSPIVLTGDPGHVGGQWDRVRVDQIVTNLLTNALKYGAGQPIEVSVTADDRTARVAVKDRGIGIAPEHHARIFGRFERAASPRHFGGLGLGLWIVKELANGMGGKITVDSRPGEGATFTLWLPKD
ncbi:MAG: Sensory box histidine kinase, partial [Myxococcaceae bacterium]|nr:Sensory box histidine kinase [Myxococcaceae bacterium]